MELFRTKTEVADFRQALRDSGRSLGLVPTMGALHRGHLELVRRALSENQEVLVTIFVNPTQFDNPEDLAKYPRSLDGDLNMLRALSDRLFVFAPEVGEMYGGEVISRPHDFGGLEDVMEGTHRPGHFDGVGTIVEALLSLILPNRAYFGEKDYQQLQIIRKLVDLRGIPVEIVPCPIVREADGLAMSSRNGRLPQALRKKAPFIHSTLLLAQSLFGTKSVAEIRHSVREAFAGEPDFELDYFEIADAANLRPARRKQKDKQYRAFVAAYLGGVRLIDNIALN
jgi:pantoate--beta-alanine ligase